MKSSPRAKAALTAGYLAATAALAGALFFVDTRRVVLFPCIFRSITGLDCPGCGMTRAFYCLLHLDFAQAFRYNPFCFVLAPILGVAWAEGLSALLRGRAFRLNHRVAKPLLCALALLLVLFDIGRNIPACPLSYFKV
ncbi:MAG: DUF2752 domain-containing protein [Clostridia bacterium]|nr:DUF2752 domain-containing protein [Clostridia bacterium]MDR3644840.1 DUF2752 domain-containing protein [Clostridia bacterium]